MNPYSVKIPPLGRHIPPPVLSSENFRPGDADADTDRNGKAVDDVFAVLRRFENVGEGEKEILPRGFVRGVYPPVQPALAQHVRYVSVFTEKTCGSADIAAEKTGGGQNDCHDFRCVHLCLTVITEIHCFQHFVTHCVKHGDFGLRFFPPRFFSCRGKYYQNMPKFSTQ